MNKALRAHRASLAMMVYLAHKESRDLPGRKASRDCPERQEREGRKANRVPKENLVLMGVQEKRVLRSRIKTAQ